MKKSLFTKENLTIHHFFAPKFASIPKMEKSPLTNSLRRGRNDSETPPSSTSSASVVETPPTPREHCGISASTPPSPTSEKRTDCECSTQPMRDESPITFSYNHRNLAKATSQSRKRKYEQLYLDFGQSSFGARTICPICNTLFVHGVQEDEANHRKKCDEYLHGVLFHGFKSLRTHIVVGINTACVVEVKQSDTNQILLDKVMAVKNIADQEMGFVSSSRVILENKVAFMYVRDKRILGFCLVEVITRAFQIVSSEDKYQGGTSTSTADSDYSNTNPNNCIDNHERTMKSDKSITREAKSSYNVDASRFGRSLSATKALMGVHQIWCHRSFRRQGISTLLLDVAREKLIFGMVVPRELIAISSPTIDGFRLACNYTDTQYPLVY